MDIVLEVFDTFVFDYAYASLVPAAPNWSGPGNATAVNNGWTFKPASEFISFAPSSAAYASAWARDSIIRQSISLYLITWLFGLVIYFACAGLSYYFIFDKANLQHPKFLKNQVGMEIKQANIAMPIMALVTAPIFVLEVRGYGYMYDTTADGPGRWYDYAQFPIFLAFTDALIYWIHRGLHHPALYKHLHKPHHKWIVPTPFASHAFHPLDGYAQSLPYHIFPFVLPLQKYAYVILFVFINVWSVLIHDGEYATNSPVINGAACHTMHHLYFNYNYGQFFTFWDRLGGSYRAPNPELFNHETKLSKDEWTRQSKEMEKIVVEVEGEDARCYEPEGAVESKKVQ
ncbi:C-5 sterol desaturase [Trichodelitschia bisporula]|uniref:C-5 sterol desaturase n=1 Tax=Trichodelitschia bisporula TaxID=703511 RepID=A0A6G1I824_9PEZI|nr:C-5 sterol desaturase [Trichodelitschia bisporula]